MASAAYIHRSSIVTDRQQEMSSQYRVKERKKKIKEAIKVVEQNCQRKHLKKPDRKVNILTAETCCRYSILPENSLSQASYVVTSYHKFHGKQEI